jgi:photosystem II stability/assembly factor-like uncharacterized protein
LRSPLPTATTLNGAAAAGNNIVAVGLKGVAVKSSDGGITWSAMDSIGEYSGGFRFDVAYGNGNFVATGRVSNVAISDDGLNWSEVELPAGTENLEAIAFGNGVFAAGGANGRLLRSVNGTSWEIGRAGSLDEGWFRSMVFANGRFLPLGDNGMFYSSDDGLNWTSQSAENTQTVGAYFNDHYIGMFGSTGTEFTDIQERGSGLPGSPSEMLVVGNRLVAVGRNGMLATSEDVKMACSGQIGAKV